MCMPLQQAAQGLAARCCAQLVKRTLCGGRPGPARERSAARPPRRGIHCRGGPHVDAASLELCAELRRGGCRRRRGRPHHKAPTARAAQGWGPSATRTLATPRLPALHAGAGLASLVYAQAHVRLSMFSNARPSSERALFCSSVAQSRPLQGEEVRRMLS